MRNTKTVESCLLPARPGRRNDKPQQNLKTLLCFDSSRKELERLECEEKSRELGRTSCCLETRRLRDKSEPHRTTVMHGWMHSWPLGRWEADTRTEQNLDLITVPLHSFFDNLHLIKSRGKYLGEKFISRRI